LEAENVKGEIMNPKLSQSRLLQSNHLFTLVVAGALLVLVVVSTKVLMARKIAPHRDANLDRNSDIYLSKLSSLPNSEECLPVHIAEENRVSILYLHCSQKALETESEAMRISEHFRVSERFSRRFHFWRKVYSLWGKYQYVLHLANHPEVVLEVYDFSKLALTMNEAAVDKLARKFSNEHRNRYRKIFETMQRVSVDQYTPTMKRIAASMAHIPDPKKYQKSVWDMRNQRGQRDFIAQGLKVSSRYLPHIQEIFREHGIPEEIANIAFVESSFNLLARSKVGASGVFQIMPATGKQYLRVTDVVDERNEPIKAARAAAKLLNLNYKLTGEWPLAITAYNHGVGGIMRARRAVGSNQLEDLIDGYDGPAFGFASKNFFGSFLGMLWTVLNVDRNFPEIEQEQLLSYRDEKLTSELNLRDLQRKYRVTPSQVYEYNPDIRRAHMRNGGRLPRGYIIKLPMPVDSTVDQRQPAGAAKRG
jgi:membrane-bound lytic murein transglycosylase D